MRVIDTGVDAPSACRVAVPRLRSPAPATIGAAEAAFAAVYAAVREHGYDVVHNHAFDAPAVELATALRAPVVHTLHLPPDEAVAEARASSGRVGRSSDRGACVSNAQAAAWAPGRHGRRGPAAVRPDARDPVLARAAARARCSRAGSAPRRERSRRSRSRGPPVSRSEVFGDAYDPDYARERIDPRARASPAWPFNPGVPRTVIWEAMARAAVVLCPALWEEPFGMVAAEAQACGTPVVAFRRGALAEVIVDGETGFLVAPGDIAAAADAVGRSPTASRGDAASTPRPSSIWS